MPAPRREEARTLGKAYGVFAFAFALVVLVIAVSAQLGLDQRIIAFLVVAVTLASYAAIGIAARTLSVGEFFAAGRNVPAGFNGLATAAAFLSAGSLLGLVGAFFAGGKAAMAVVVGWTAGFVLLATLIAPYFRKSGALSVPDFLAVRYGNTLVRLAAVAALAISSLALLPAAIALAVRISVEYLHIPEGPALSVVVLVILLSTLPGGVRAVTLVAGAQMTVVLFAVLVPPALLAARMFGVPLPQATYGLALAGGDVPFGAVAGMLSPLSAFDPLSLLAVALSLALGVASLPQVLARSATIRSGTAARRSIGWALVIIAAIALTAPAIAGFARAAIAGSVVAVPLDALPDWLFALGRHGLATVCGADAVSPAAIGLACGAGVVANGIAPADLVVSGDGIALAFADITDLPHVMTALIGAGALAAALAIANATLMTVTVSFGHDIYTRLLNRRATAGRRLIFSRLILVAVLLLSTGLAVNEPRGVLALALAAPSLAASAFFPALVLGIWWSRTTWLGALCGMVAGLATAILSIAFAGHGISAGATAATALSAATSAILGVPAGFIVAVGVSFLTPEPSAARLDVVEAIRRPGREAVLEDQAA